MLKHIPKNSNIITHNPWGEYGHSEHCQVFKACFKLSCLTNSKLFVSNYVSNLSKFYAKKKIYLLTKEFYSYNTNIEIYNLLYKHYEGYGCWTWYHNYYLPKQETFLRVNLNQDPNLIMKENAFHLLPLNMIQHINPFLFYIKGVLRNFVPLAFKNVYRLIKQ